MSPNSSAGIQGQFTPADSASDFNANHFLVKAILSGIATVTIVKVMAVTNEGGLSAVGFVDLQPQVNQVDGDGNAVPHGTIYGCPYSRLQGGGDAVIIDPKIGDLGIAVFASRDIAGVIATRAQSNPGGNASFQWSDAMYVGGILNGVPTQWIRFYDGGIEMSSPTAITIEAPSIMLTAPEIVMNASTSITATTPLFTLNGAFQSTETVTAAELVAPVATIAETLKVAGVDVGPAHKHGHGTMTSTGETDEVIP